MDIRHILKRFCRLTILALVFIVPLIYPLKVSDTVYLKLSDFFQSSSLNWFWNYNLEPFLFFSFSPLALKETVANGLIVALFAGFLFYTALSNRETNATKRSFLLLHTPVLLLIIYSGISLLYSPTFYYSFHTWFNMTTCTIFFIVLIELCDSRRFFNKIIFVVLVVGVIQTLVSFMQHLDLTRFMLPEFDDARNRMGAFIGHNTGLSMFLLFSFFLFLVVLIFNKNRYLKVISLASLVLESFVLVAAQSRGTWISLLITIPIFLILIRRYAGFTVRTRNVLIGCIVILLIILTQVIPNPLNSPDVTFRQRLQHFSGERMKSETRLRVLVTSTPLLRERPVFGHGIGSFQYVYPKVQGEYFVYNPDTELIPTPKRTQRAHNEYLQTLIELGLVGFLLGILALYVYLKTGWIAFKSIRRARDRATMCAIFSSIIALIIQAFVDFPLHIAPLALYFLLFLALWASGSRIFSESTEGDAKPLPRPRGEKIAFLLIAIVFLLVSPFIMRFNTIHYAADIMNQRATSFVKTFYLESQAPISRKIDLLKGAHSAIHRAIRLEPLLGLNSFKAAEVYYLFASVSVDIAEQYTKASDEQSVRKLVYYRSRAQNYFQKALFFVQMSLEEMRVHSNYYLLGLINRDLGYLAEQTGNQEAAHEYFNRAKESFLVAIKFSQAYSPALHDLAELILRDPQPNMMFVNELRAKIAKYDPEFFESRYIKRLMDAEIYGDYERGLEIAKALLQIAPEHPDLHRALFHAYLYLGDLDSAENELEAVKKYVPEYPELFTLYYLHRKDWQEAQKWLDIALDNPKITSLSYFYAVKPLLLEKLGKQDEAQKILDEMMNDTHRLDHLRRLGEAAYTLFDQKERGVKYLEEVLESGRTTSPIVLFFVASYYYEQGDAVKALEKIDKYKKITIGPYKDKLENLESTIRKELQQ